MGPVLDLQGTTETTMEVSTSKDHKSNQECTFDAPLAKQDSEVRILEDVNVDIINCTNDDICASVEPQSDNATGSSSSFGDTNSENGNRECESDDEVLSELCGDVAKMRGYGGLGDLFPMRKKKLTSHWRKYIQPLMWRCKWVELQIKKFQLQANKYDKVLEKRYQTKQLKHKNIESEGLCAKSMPFSQDSPRGKPMKRKIRKRHEELNTEVFSSPHNLFSYFDARKSTVGAATIDDDQTNLAAASTHKHTSNEFRVPDELLSLDFRDGYLLEQVLWKIEAAQSQVSQMKTRLNTVKTENAGRFSYTEELNLLENSNDSDKEPDGSSVGASFASQLMKYNTGGDIVKSESAASSHEEGRQLHDVNEHTGQPPVASRKRSPDGILIYNRRAKKPQTDSGLVKIHPIENLVAPKQEKSEDPARVSVSEEEAAPKLRSVSKLTAPNNKRKRAARARRKSGSSLWSRSTSG